MFVLIQLKVGEGRQCGSKAVEMEINRTVRPSFLDACIDSMTREHLHPIQEEGNA